MTTLLSMLVGETALDSCSDSGIKVTDDSVHDSDFLA